MKYEINYAPVGADKNRAWRVDQVDDSTGNWHTIQGGLTKSEAESLMVDLSREESEQE